MHSRIARYRFSGAAQDLARRAEEGMVPVFESLPGFRAYTLIESEGEIFSLSAWDTADHADAASGTAKEWIAENMRGEIELLEAHTGEVLLSTALGVTPGVTA